MICRLQRCCSSPVRPAWPGWLLPSRTIQAAGAFGRPSGLRVSRTRRSGYARLDYRITEDGEPYLLEANPNPQIAKDEDFAFSAKHIGMDYPELIERLIQFGINYAPERMVG